MLLIDAQIMIYASLHSPFRIREATYADALILNFAKDKKRIWNYICNICQKNIC